MRDAGFEMRDSGFGIRVSGFGFRVSGFGIRDSGLEPWVAVHQLSAVHLTEIVYTVVLQKSIPGQISQRILSFY